MKPPPRVKKVLEPKAVFAPAIECVARRNTLAFGKHLLLFVYSLYLCKGILVSLFHDLGFKCRDRIDVDLQKLE